MVRRLAELARVVKALVGGGPATVGVTTGLYGAGGFGKTTLAQMVCADRQVRQRFGGRVYLVTVGRDVLGAAAIAAKVNDVIKLVAGEDATYADPQLAGRRVGALLDAGRGGCWFWMMCGRRSSWRRSPRAASGATGW